LIPHKKAAKEFIPSIREPEVSCWFDGVTTIPYLHIFGTYISSAPAATTLPSRISSLSQPHTSDSLQQSTRRAQL